MKKGFQGFALARNSYEAVSGWLTWKVFHIKHCFDSPAPLPLARSYLHFAFFHGVIASEGNWNWSDIYPPHTKAQSQICCNWKTFGNISSIDFDILPFGTSLEFWLARKNSDLKKSWIFIYFPCILVFFSATQYSICRNMFRSNLHQVGPSNVIICIWAEFQID